MKRTKMSLANIAGKLSRSEMKNIMAGSLGAAGCKAGCTGTCTFSTGGSGNCRYNTEQTKCHCLGAS